MKTIRLQCQGWCQHSNPDPNRFEPGVKCKAGVEYYALVDIEKNGRQGCALRLPCHGDTGETRGIPVSPCDKYEPLTEEMIAEHEKDVQRTIDCLRADVSSCCEAPIDKSQVIKDGKHKNHGPRFCSKCKKMVYMV